MKKPEEWLQLVIETVISDSFSSRSQSSEPVRQLIEAIQQDARSDYAGLVEHKNQKEFRELLLRGIIGLRNPAWHLNPSNENRLLYACLCAYRKMVPGNDNLGWDEVGDILHNQICSIIGDDVYCQWNDVDWDGEQPPPQSARKDGGE